MMPARLLSYRFVEVSARSLLI